MNLKNKLYFANKRRKNGKMYAFSLVLIIVAMLLLYSSILIYTGLTYGEKSVRQSLRGSITSAGIIVLPDNLDADKMMEFIDEAYALEEIDAIGYYECAGFSGNMETQGAVDYWTKLLEIQNRRDLEFEDDGASVQAVLMNSELYNMQNIPLYQEGDHGIDGSTSHQILLGYNYKEIPIGTVFSDGLYEFEVAGVMKKGTYVTAPECIGWNLGGLTLGYKVKLDNMILVLEPEGFGTFGVTNLFSAKEGYTFDEAKDALKKLADEWGIQVRIGSMTSRLDSIFSSNRKIKERIDAIALVLIASVFTICVTVQLLSLYLKRNELGIWLANGMSRREIVQILWIENFIKIFVGTVIAVVAETVLIKHFLPISASDVREVLSMMYHTPLLLLVLAGIIMVCIISAFPAMVISKKKTTDLVKGVWS